MSILHALPDEVVLHAPEILVKALEAALPKQTDAHYHVDDED